MFEKEEFLIAKVDVTATIEIPDAVWILSPAPEEEQEALHVLLRDNGYSTEGSIVYRCNDGRPAVMFGPKLNSHDAEWMYRKFLESIAHNINTHDLGKV